MLLKTKQQQNIEQDLNEHGQISAESWRDERTRAVFTNHEATETRATYSTKSMIAEHCVLRRNIV